MIRAVDGYDGVGNGCFAGSVKSRDEVVGVVEAAGELCGILGDRIGRERCEELIVEWQLDLQREGLDEREIVE